MLYKALLFWVDYLKAGTQGLKQWLKFCDQPSNCLLIHIIHSEALHHMESC